MRLDPGASIGVIGGGQLGRMFILECRRMGYRSAVIDSDLKGPAAQVADRTFPPHDVDPFCQYCQVATYEFEHVQMDMVRRIEERTALRPKAQVLEIKRNRIAEKTWLDQKGFPVAPFRIFNKGEEIAIEKDQLPVVVKIATGGYDGKGLYIVKTEAELSPVREGFGSEVIVEKYIPYVKEISVMCARDEKGNVALYPPGENVHRDGILFYTIVPTNLTRKERQRAHELAADLAATLDLVGIVGVEMFLLEDGEILINEFAPRPHNSGHYTMDGCNISQFEMLLRAICGLPLSEPELICPTAMLNILGQAPQQIPWEEVLALDGVKVHLYGKQEARPKRKLGHINVVGKTLMEVTERLMTIKDLVYSS